MTEFLTLPLAAVVALAAWRTRSLTGSGAVAAALCGWIALSAGIDWAIILITYFISASVISRVGERGQRATSEIVAKTGARDAAQVFANGGAFMLLALASILTPHPIWLLGALSALATSAADTFATEIGAFSHRPPRSIISGRPVPAGTSGGLSWPGTAGAALGALCVSVTGYAVGWPFVTTIIAFFAGMLGMLVDSLLGATIQDRRECPVCRTLTERAVHTCGTTTRRSGGIAWIGNDLVNGLATFAGALIGMLFSILA